MVSPESQPAIEVADLTIRYGDRIAVNGLSFTAMSGQITALLGPNGAGKTSTVETLEGYRRPTAGSVRVLGLDPVADHRRLVARIGVMLQSGGVATGMRPGEALRLFASYYDNPVDPDDLLDLVGLADHRSSTWRSMSGGEQQRVALARAFVMRPTLLMADEPTGSLDFATGESVMQLMFSLNAEVGTTLLLVTHDAGIAKRCQQTLTLAAGRVVLPG